MEPKIITGLTHDDRAPTVLAVATALARRLDLPVEVVSSPTDGGPALADVVDLDDADRVTITHGPPAAVLRAAMGDGGVLGVVGTRGRSPMRGALLGSVSTELTKIAPSPVVVVPEGARIPEFDDAPSLAVRLDGSSEDLRTLHAAVRLADALGAQMLAINIAAPPPGSPLRPPAERVERELATLPPVRTAIRIEADDPIGMLRDVAGRHDASLLVVGGRDTSRLRDGLGGNVAVKLMAEARRPVVVVPPGARTDAGWLASLERLGV
jgi:nucleotide-binding universal stress UspA family protein